MTISNTIYEMAYSYKGLKEIPGSKHNDVVVKFYKDAGHPEIKEDEVPWCAAFVGAVLAQVGLPNSGSLLARSYENYGKEVPFNEAKRGDIVVLSRGKPWQGHVAFFSGYEKGQIQLLGGNQSNQVKIASYNRGRIVAIRRAKEPRVSAKSSKSIKAALGVVGGSGASGIFVSFSSMETPVQLTMIAIFTAFGLLGLFLFWDRLRKWSQGVR